MNKRRRQEQQDEGNNMWKLGCILTIWYDVGVIYVLFQIYFRKFRTYPIFIITQNMYCDI